MQSKEQLIAVHVNGLSYSFSRSDNAAAGSIYGGPLREKVTGTQFGPARLHHVASLSASSISFLRKPPLYIADLPLVYGFRFDGCALEYRFGPTEIEVLAISPNRSADDWPYLDYPALLPYIPIEAEPPVREAWKDFAARFPMSSDEPPADLIAVVPPAFFTGHSLWGRDGDLEGACVVFECDLGRQLVRTYNVCS